MKRSFALLLAVLTAAAFLGFAALAETPSTLPGQETSGEMCRISISNKECFFVYAGTRDTVPNQLAAGTEFSFNIVFDPGKSSKTVTVYANGTEIPLVDGKYTYTINEDTVFDVVTDGSRPSASSGKGLSVGEILLIAGGVALVGVVAWIVLANKREEKKAGNNKK